MPSHVKPPRKRRAPTWRQHDPHDPDHWELQLQAELFLVLRKVRFGGPTSPDVWVVELELQGSVVGYAVELKAKRLQTAQAEGIRKLLSLITPVQDAAMLALDALP